MPGNVMKLLSLLSSVCGHNNGCFYFQFILMKVYLFSQKCSINSQIIQQLLKYWRIHFWVCFIWAHFSEFEFLFQNHIAELYVQFWSIFLEYMHFLLVMIYFSFCGAKQQVRSGDFARIQPSPAGSDCNNHRSGYLSVQPLCRRPGRDRIWRLMLATGTVKGTIPNTLLSSSHLRRGVQGSYVQL